jgi:antitoxin component of RelBE/YafQ-DinJ toxin-antitoxin module
MKQTKTIFRPRPQMQTTVNFRLHESTRQELIKIARNDGVTVSDVCRGIISKYLKK